MENKEHNCVKCGKDLTPIHTNGQTEMRFAVKFHNGYVCWSCLQRHKFFKCEHCREWHFYDEEHLVREAKILGLCRSCYQLFLDGKLAQEDAISYLRSVFFRPFRKLQLLQEHFKGDLDDNAWSVKSLQEFVDSLGKELRVLDRFDDILWLLENRQIRHLDTLEDRV